MMLVQASVLPANLPTAWPLQSPFRDALQFQTTTDLLIAVNPELAAGGPLAPGTQVKLPPV